MSVLFIHTVDAGVMRIEGDLRVWTREGSMIASALPTFLKNASQDDYIEFDSEWYWTPNDDEDGESWQPVTTVKQTYAGRATILVRHITRFDVGEEV